MNCESLNQIIADIPEVEDVDYLDLITKQIQAIAMEIEN